MTVYSPGGNNKKTVNPFPLQLRLTKAVNAPVRSSSQMGTMQSLPATRRIVRTDDGGGGGGGGWGDDDGGGGGRNNDSAFIRRMRKHLDRGDVLEAIREYELHKAQLMHLRMVLKNRKYAGAVARLLDMARKSGKKAENHVAGQYRSNSSGTESVHVDADRGTDPWSANAPEASRASEAHEMFEAVKDMSPNDPGVQRMFRWLIAGPSQFHPDGPTKKDFYKITQGKKISHAALGRYLFGHGLRPIVALLKTLAEHQLNKKGQSNIPSIAPLKGDISKLFLLARKAYDPMWLDQSQAQHMFRYALGHSPSRYSSPELRQLMEDIAKQHGGKIHPDVLTLADFFEQFAKKIKDPNAGPELRAIAAASANDQHQKWDHTAAQDGFHPDSSGQAMHILPSGQFWEGDPMGLSEQYWHTPDTTRGTTIKDDEGKPLDISRGYARPPRPLYSPEGLAWSRDTVQQPRHTAYDIFENIVNEGPGKHFVPEFYDTPEGRAFAESGQVPEEQGNLPFSATNASLSPRELIEGHPSKDDLAQFRAEALRDHPFIQHAIRAHYGPGYSMELGRRFGQRNQDASLVHTDEQGNRRYIEPFVNVGGNKMLWETLRTFDPDASMPTAYPPKRPAAMKPRGTTDEMKRILEQGSSSVQPPEINSRPELRNSLTFPRNERMVGVFKK
jgi:hypothetical protein